MQPLIVSDGLCSFFLIDSNWTNSSNIKDINHWVTCFFWTDMTGQSKPIQCLRYEMTGLPAPHRPKPPSIHLEMCHPYTFSKMSQKPFYLTLPLWILNVSTDIYSAVLCSWLELLSTQVSLPVSGFFLDKFWFNLIYPHFISTVNPVQVAFQRCLPKIKTKRMPVFFFFLENSWC